MLGHQLNRLGARRRIFFHAALAIELVARVEELFVIARADQLIQFNSGEAFIEIDFLGGDLVFAKPTLRFAACGSGGL